MKYLIFFLLFPFFGYGQCVVTSITFGSVGECSEVDNTFKVPVTVNYTGVPEKIYIQIFDADYSYTPQEFTNVPFQSFTFIVYNDSDGGSGSFSVEASLIGGGCVGESRMEVYNYTAPANCSNNCPENLVLTGVVDSDGVYEASVTIESDQTINGKDVRMGATQSVTLKAGFSYTPSSGKSLLINNQGCTN